MSVKQTVLHPAYYTNFSCIGGACEDNCCEINWTITVDKSTYMQYRKIKDADFSQKISQCVRRVKGPKASDSHYAEFILPKKEDGSRACPFHQENGLCEIHAKMGEKHLSITCMIYPRQFNQVMPNILEASLSMSCPEAIRKGILSSEPITFQLSEQVFENVKLLNGLRVSLPIHAQADQATAHAWNMREACIDIMQDKQYPLPERLLIIGLALKKASELNEAGKAAEISAAVATYKNAAAAGEFKDLLAKTKQSETVGAAVSTVLYQYAFVLRQNSDKHYAPLRALTGDFITGFEHTFSEEMETLLEDETRTYDIALELYKYVQGMVHGHWNSILEDYEQQLENYFVNYMFAAVFPFEYHRDVSIYHHFILLVEQYAFLRMLLSYTEVNGGITEQKLISVITCVATISQHINNKKHLTDLYKTNGCDDLAHMSFLLQ